MLRELRVASARVLAAGAVQRLASGTGAAAPVRPPRWALPRGLAAAGRPISLDRGALAGVTGRCRAGRRLHCSAMLALTASAAAASASEGCTEAAANPAPDWKVGVALAGAAFEAYRELSEKGVPERHSDGTEVYYVDRDFVQEKLAGLLQVSIKRARSLPAADPWPGSSDPYVTVSVGDCTHTTKTVMNSLNPDWEESCTLFVKDIARQALKVRVMDYDFGSSTDDYLGSAVHGLGKLCDGQQHELDLELRGSSFAPGGANCQSRDGDGSADGGDGASGGGGSVQLSVRFFPFSDMAAQDASDSEIGGPVVGAPGKIPLADDWQKLLDMAGVATHTMFKPVAYVEHATTNSQAWLYWNKEERTACVAFRGTEQGKWKDILTDLHLVPAPLDPDRVASAPRKAALAQISQPPEEPGTLSQIMEKVEQAKQQVVAERQQQAEQQCSEEQAEQHILATAVSTVRSTAEDIKQVLERVQQDIKAAEERTQECEQEGQEDQVWVHSGFITAWDSLRPSVLSLLATMLEGEEGQWRLFLTGHSLGGAIATLCAWDCAHRTWPCEHPPELIVYNFGSPRVGNRAFADHYNQRVPSTWRIVNANDTVCTVPRLMGYAHVGHAIHLKGTGEVQVEMNTTERLGEGIKLPDVAPAVTAAVQASVAAKVPELIPQAATDLLKKVGLEVANAGSSDDEPNAAAEAALAALTGSADTLASAGSSDGSSDGDSVAGGEAADGEAVASTRGSAASILVEHLPDLWKQEMEAWSLLLDGSALNEHMEPLYLENLRAYLQAMVEEGQQTQGPKEAGGQQTQGPKEAGGQQQQQAGAPDLDGSSEQRQTIKAAAASAAASGLPAGSKQQLF